MKEKEKSKKRKSRKKILLILLAVVLVLIIGVICGAGALFSEELKIIGSIEKVSDDKPVYYMEVDGDYHFEEFLEQGGASSDGEVSAFLTKKISKGFYSVDVEEDGLACSTISAMTPDGAHIWARNYDWTGAVPIIVKCTPEDGYSSISTCDFQHITGNPETVPEGMFNQMLAVAALYVPMDGINEAGLCVADLEVNEGGMADVDTEKTDLTITNAIRLLLNKAATVKEAIELLEQYDIHASAGISHHLSISDAEGNSAAIEFVDGEPVAVDTCSVTNFNLAGGDISAGGDSAKERYEYLTSAYEESNGILTADQVKESISQVAQPDGEWTTQWSIVYDQGSMTANYYFNSDYTSAYSYTLGKE
ncbi:MAG: linear amide C-N hydrolase [Eubacteriales bacterium]|nr:linear amide C-N hydrolase [Eubacteriales bacterium]